jgi:hypothetical protein
VQYESRQVCVFCGQFSLALRYSVLLVVCDDISLVGLGYTPLIYVPTRIALEW